MKKLDRGLKNVVNYTTMLQIPHSYFKSLARACAALKCFRPETPELTTNQIAKQIDMHRTTVHRMLVTLCDFGFLEKSESQGKYRVGPALYVLGSLYLETTNIVKAARPVMNALNQITDETINLSILENGYTTLIMREEAKHGYRWAAHIGTTLPAYCSSQGKALLSGLTDQEIDNLYPDEHFRPLTRKTIATKSDLKKDLTQIRETGVAYNKEGAYEGIEGIASMIRNVSEEVIATVNVAVPVYRMDDNRREKFTKLVRVAAELISYRLGYVGKDNRIHNVEQLYSWWKHEDDSPDYGDKL